MNLFVMDLIVEAARRIRMIDAYVRSDSVVSCDIGRALHNQ